MNAVARPSVAVARSLDVLGNDASAKAPTDRLLQVVPRRSRRPEGIRDYARLLADEVWRSSGIETVFVSGTPLPESEQLQDRWTTHTVAARSKSALLEAIESAGSFGRMLIHASGYGYANRGAPLWLAAGLETWKARHQGIPTNVLFHELSASTVKPWQSSFWLSPLQASVSRRIARMSDAAFCTTTPFANEVSAWLGGRPVKAVPVFSTVGEVETIVTTSARPRVLVTFGTPKVRDRVYVEGAERLRSVVDQLGVEQIWDIGGRNAPMPEAVGPARIAARGRCEAEDICEMFAKAAFGIVDYPALYLQKSTVCAAFAGLGVIPILLRERHSKSGAGFTCLGHDIGISEVTPSRLKAIQQKNFDTYHNQSAISVVARQLAEALADGIAGAPTSHRRHQ